MRNLWCGGELRPIPALCAVAVLAVALFAWAHATEVTVDREGVDSLDNNLWRLWQLGTLLLAFAGVWRLWFATRGVPWVRSLALAVFALAVFLNTYDRTFFGADWGNVWEVVNALFIALCSLASVYLWRCGCAAGKVGAVIAAALGITDFANAYFLNIVVIWWVMNPLMILAALSWAGAAGYVNVNRTAGGSAVCCRGHSDVR